VYRLAALLSGNPLAAGEVIHAVLDAQPNLDAMESARMDRLTVLRSREIEPGRIVDDRIPAGLAEAIAHLSPQQREAWVLVRIYHVPMREAARAMDCSVTALTQHMKLSQDAMETALGLAGSMTQDDAAELLRAWSLALDVPQFIVQAEHRRKRTRIALGIVIVILAVGAIVGALAVIRALETPAHTRSEAATAPTTTTVQPND